MNNWEIVALPIVSVIAVTIASQLLASVIVNRLSYSQLDQWRLWLRARSWEHEGNFYQKWFRVKAWKPLVPEAGNMSPYKFRKKHLQHIDQNYVLQFIRESVRAELDHSLTLFMSIPIILICPPPYVKWLVLYTILLNVPCVIIQRYNRPRFERILKNTEKGKQKAATSEPTVCPSYPVFEDQSRKQAFHS